MLRWLILSCVLYCRGTVDCLGETGPGIWHVQYVQKCEQDNHELKIDLQQNKINRTHDGWNGRIVITKAIENGISVNLDIAKRVDGGYRRQQVISDPDFIQYCFKNAEKNVKGILKNAGVDPPDFPVKAGEYDLKEYLLNYDEMPKEGIYGDFFAVGQLFRNGVEIACIEVYIDFYEEEDNDDDC